MTETDEESKEYDLKKTEEENAKAIKYAKAMER